MDAAKTTKTEAYGKNVAALAAATALLMWVSQPPLVIWPLAMLAIVPLLKIAVIAGRLGRREYMLIWLAGFVYWAISLQGLRHANPLIYPCWIALAAYLATYMVLFVLILRQMLVRRFPIWLAAPFAWVGVECIRNYLLTGISAAMLGHTLADVPVMIQIADIFGSYGVSFVIVSINVALLEVWMLIQNRKPSDSQPERSQDSVWQARLLKATSRSSLIASIIAAIVLVSATLGYGSLRLAESVDQQLATFALIQRNERVEYQQDESREFEIFENYAQQTIVSVNGSERDIDAVVWPESMFSGALPWRIAEQYANPPAAFEMPAAEFHALIKQNREYFLQRARDLQNAIAVTRRSPGLRHLIAGCGVIYYGKMPEVYSGVVHVTGDFVNQAGGDQQVPPVDWYGKTHLVMFGEYIPLVSKIPWIADYVNSIGLGLATGPGAKAFMINGTAVSPNICIETAVERVTVNQLASLRSKGEMPDVVITVTNDGWFDDSSVIDHHLRCGQFVAVGCRRPLLSAANNGPTAWVDSCGRIIKRLPTGTNGAVIATPLRDQRESLYLRIGDFPARILGLLCVVFGVDAFLRLRREKQPASGEEITAS